MTLGNGRISGNLRGLRLPLARKLAAEPQLLVRFLTAAPCSRGSCPPAQWSSRSKDKLRVERALYDTAPKRADAASMTVLAIWR